MARPLSLRRPPTQTDGQGHAKLRRSNIASKPERVRVVVDTSSLHRHVGGSELGAKQGWRTKCVKTKPKELPSINPFVPSDSIRTSGWVFARIFTPRHPAIAAHPMGKIFLVPQHRPRQSKIRVMAQKQNHNLEVIKQRVTRANLVVAQPLLNCLSHVIRRYLPCGETR